MITKLLILSILEKEEKLFRSTCLVSIITTRLFVLSILEDYYAEYLILLNRLPELPP